MEKQKKTAHKGSSLRKRLNWKGFFIAVVAVIIIELLAVRLLHTGEPHITLPETGISDMKQYTNETMGFSVKVPSGWYSHRETLKGLKTEAVFSYPVDSNNAEVWIPNQEARLSVLKYPSSGEDIKAEATQWITTVEKTSPNTFKKELKTMSVGGKTAIVIQTADNHTQFIYLTNGYSTYNITLGTPKEVPFSKYQKTFDQILSTFLFTN